MEKFFYPQSLAVVGVSEAPDNLARGIAANLLQFGYQGKIFLVGPRGGEFLGLPILKGMEYLPQPVDLAAILSPARYVPDIVQACGRMEIKRIVVESAGFSELNDAGRALEEQVRGLLKQYNLRLVGPNGLGLMNLENGLALPFAQFDPKPLKGKISVIAQSGGVATHLFAWMSREGLGLNKFLSLGNKLDVGENEVLAYLLEDPGTEAVYLYLEGLQDGRTLLDLARRANKPIFLHLLNVGPETEAIGQSHTASLTTDERVLEAACRQGGMLRIIHQWDFLNAAKLVGQPPVKGPRLMILSRSGGEALVSAYAARQWGFQLPPLSPALTALLKERSRAGIIRPNNPIDLGDIFDFTVYSDLMAGFCADPEVDAILFNYGPVADFEMEPARRMARHLVEQARKAGKPLAVCVLCTLNEEEFFRETLGVPVFHFPEDAVQALAGSREWGGREDLGNTTATGGGARVQTLASSREEGGWEDRAASPADVSGCDWDQISIILAQAPAGFLPLPQALALAAALGIPAAPWEASDNPEDAAAAAGRLGYPVVLKLSAASLIHKTEAGAVLLNLLDAGQVQAGFGRLARAAQEHLPAGEPWQVVVMAQVSGGREVLVGARQDRAFGPVLAFGAGGVDTEILEDVALRVAPVDLTQARGLIRETRAGRLLSGIRGGPAADLEALGRAITSLSQALLQFPQIQEVDFNPVLAFPGRPGIIALDARIRVG